MTKWLIIVFVFWNYSYWAGYGDEYIIKEEWKIFKNYELAEEFVIELKNSPSYNRKHPTGISDIEIINTCDCNND